MVFSVWILVVLGHGNMRLSRLQPGLAGGGLIVDPLTGKKHPINEKMGKSILKRYIKHYKDKK